MKNILDEGKNKIKEIKQELITLEEYKERAKNAQNQEIRYEKELRQKERDVEDEITSTIRKRRADVEKSYDTQINQTKSKLKKVTDSREKDKNKKMESRIKDETSELVSANRLIKSDIKSIIYKDKIPSICRTDFYFSLYRPSQIKDFVTIIVVIAILLAALPWGIFAVTPWEEGPFLKVLAYVVIVLLFGGAYIIVGNTINSWHKDQLDKIYQKKQQIKCNKKEIKKIIHHIKHDKDDSIYNLGKYDKEMDEINDNVDELVKQKKDALATFENSTRNIIESEIKSRNEKQIDELAKNYNKAGKDASRLMDVVDKMTIDISSKYEAYFGKDLLKVDKMDALIEIIDKGEAKTISEAISVYKNRYTI